MARKVLIVGGVAGGASCAARLRRLDEQAKIVVFERGEYVSFANCGLPYHVGGVIAERDNLILLEPEEMALKYNLDVRVRHEVVSIDRSSKRVTVKRLDTGETYTEDYDTLVLSTGSSPLKPPIPGIESPRVMTLWTIPDMDAIRSFIERSGAKSAVVVGGGFIGLEMAENLHLRGLEVSIAEMLDQVMAPLDFEMAQLLHEHLERKGVRLCLGDGVEKFEDTGSGVAVVLKSGTRLDADIVILSVGVTPNSSLAKAAGLETGARGGIVVDETLRTSDPDIYAVGDAIEVEDFVLKDRAMIPLAGPANKQGPIAADNIAGGHKTYDGTQGTSIAKVFDLTAAATGANEKALLRKGLVRDRDYKTIIITQNSHASYYPGAVPMTLKLIFSADGKKIYGAQIVGADGVDKRIDTIAATIRLGGGVKELSSLELAYAPPYSSAKDPVNMAGFVAENVLSGRVRFAAWDIDIARPGTVALDVREDAELKAYSLPAYKHIPLGQLRKRLGELDRKSEIVVFCAIGVRAYNASRILMENGFPNVSVYPGGVRFYRSTHYRLSGPAGPSAAVTAPVHDTGQPKEEPPAAAVRLNCSGMQCPGPIMKVFEAMKKLKSGEVLEVTASDPGFLRDIEAWARRTGNALISSEKRGAEYVALIRKEDAPAATATAERRDGKTIIVFSGDLDRVLAAFIIANGAAAMGRPVTMFFTFWGLNVLRKPEKVRVKKTPVERMFGRMMPRGAGRLRLSKMNMAGMGTAMMRMIMRKKGVDSLEELIRKAMENGVKIVACTMSMDVMGISKEELIDGIDFAGVGNYLGDAEESDVNLFI